MITKSYAFLFSASKHSDYDWLILPEFIPLEKRFELAGKIGFRPAYTERNKKIITFGWPNYLLVYWHTDNCMDHNGNILVDDFGRNLWRFFGVISKGYFPSVGNLSERKIQQLLKQSDIEISKLLNTNAESKNLLKSTPLQTSQIFIP